MRRRLSTSAHDEEMEKANGKSPPSRLCFLATLAAMFWIMIFYFHFTVLSSNPISIPEQSVPFPSISSKSQRISEAYEALELLKMMAKPKPKPSDVHLDTHKAPEVFPFTRALQTIENNTDPCGGRYIYVHDLPSRFNADMLRDCRQLSLWTNMCKFTSNAGLGPPLENVEGVFSNTGWYATNQFAVDVIFNNRMKQYECLTKDSSIAAAFFVPFYAGFDIALSLGIQHLS
ncbi:hypothetical protein B296_00047845 [Ensete ventricosum]|uniref:Exostosin GT47 domain-containing protein n=1 Tax=Ensete ventricosum TaxID=4639 RepID=A0A426YV63_ENSVE|nr:hypothetical protein B296_00047845 [Ensete ventricosum]